MCVLIVSYIGCFVDIKGILEFIEVLVIVVGEYFFLCIVMVGGLFDNLKSEKRWCVCILKVLLSAELLGWLIFFELDKIY